ncbi:MULTISPECIES: caspase family protein [Calothrix]|uniref:Caspase family protein n=2 Tax=Calothrix TaxID=1186 RepID=A0ABR8A3X4_9CYAN|nr:MULTISPECIES: caspase family protein [Calothrix]MBD2194628.1 caspase family protein [Calothrix parietina FACHB-288]MBD2223266.1 caspase family protein [Calothrix anomala FACHB-343]
MTRNLYALLVGIDEYVYPISPLQGCVNDIYAIQEYLEGRIDTGEYQLHLRTLLNKEATRQAIIDGFRQHLCQAESEDVAFFYYAGHGSQQEAPQEFWTIELDRLNETIVCYDSQKSGEWGLADKEMAKLIAEIAQKNPHITIIMDCCHSSSGTRGDLETDTAERKAPIDSRKRPLESFLVSPLEVEQLLTERNLVKAPTGENLPRAKHIFFAACRDSETAKEYAINGQRRGAFSYFLVDTLKKANGNLTYRDLFKRTHALVRSKVLAQSPQLEATDLDDIEQPFLGGAIAQHKPYLTVSYHPDYQWVIDAGSVHGIPQPSGEETTLLALFPFDSSPQQMQKLSAAIGEAKVIAVKPQLSLVQISGIAALEPEMTFKGAIASLPLPPKGVVITGEPAAVELARTALQTINGSNQPSLYLKEVATPEEAEFKLLARNGQYTITRPADDRPLVAPIQGYTEKNALQAIERLEHITRWTNIAELSSPATSSIPADAVQIVIYQEDKELKDSEINLHYQQQNGKWQGPAFKLKLKNTSNQELFCALLDLTDSYAVSPELLETGGIWLKPGQEAWALRGENIYPTVREKLWKQGITQSRDILKLIVSTAEFDATLLKQNELDLPFFPEREVGRGNGTLNRLMKRVQSRDLRAAPEEEELYDDWITSQIHITTVRPRA